jgi:hypothetical protein
LAFLCLAYQLALPCLASPAKFDGQPSSALPDLVLRLALTKLRQRRGRTDENTDLRLNHENLLRPYEVLKCEGAFYIISEHMAASLDHFIGCDEPLS